MREQLLRVLAGSYRPPHELEPTFGLPKTERDSRWETARGQIDALQLKWSVARNRYLLTR